MKDKTNISFWGRFARIYDVFMKKDNGAYTRMYTLIRARLTSHMNVLELATGTGLIAMAIADKVSSVEATDFSPQMISEAKKKNAPENVNFSVQDACSLPYEDGSFDCVIISNALHIMPDPGLALENIRRVLKDGGVLIASTFTHAGNDKCGKLKAHFMELFGFKAYHKWTEEQYCEFIKSNGFSIAQEIVLKASFPLTYVEAQKIL
jgi:Methylase involved in ubiquinone/menaquinone biosynthesis